MPCHKPTSNDRITELFESAVDLPPAERSAFLARECGSDAALRDEVESLLAHDAEASHGFMRTPDRPGAGLGGPWLQPWGKRFGTGVDSPTSKEVGHPRKAGHPSTTTGQADRFIGQRIGGYRIKSVIASGGMGTVYLAEQERPQRDVALKVIQAGVASRDALRRFEFESQALARLRHPNIAHVYEAGVHEPEGSAGLPVPYFAMEFIPDARLITRHADERKLDTVQRLALFAKVCDAVHHGHQKGIIHRDIKPGNILVDATGEPKVIDFGVARSTDSDVAVTTMRTDVGQLIGTLQYMSPEQCDADPNEIDTRSDVYSLGVVLYELLTGARPYDATGSSIYRATRLIKETVPPSPSSIKRQLRGDIETIILKAIEKDPARRYQSAGEFGNDIRHVLCREPIEARTPTLWSRAVRWVSRHPIVGTATLATAVALVIIALLPSVTWWYGSRIPHDVIVSDDQTRADLVSLAGNTLYTWETDGIVDAKLLRHGDARYVVIGFAAEARTRFARKLCVFDARGPYDEPIWTSSLAKDQMPQTDRDGFAPEDFFVAGVETFDVFPEIDGPEIVAAFANRYSWRALRIYSLDGRLLYQVWHDGWLGQFYWMSDAQVLIVTGDNHECYWKDRGFSKYKSTVPQVVFGLRPRAGYISKRLLDVYCDEGDNCPAWYRTVGPRHLTEVIKLSTLNAPEHSRFDPRDHVDLAFVLNSDSEVGASWIIDAKGRLASDEILTNDAFNRLENPPDLSDFRLADISELPPCADPGGDDGSTSNPPSPD